MAKNKNYLNNEELKSELLKCINEGYDLAVANGYTVDIDPFESEDPEIIQIHDNAIKLGYYPERSAWIKEVREFDEKELDKCVEEGTVSKEEAERYKSQRQRPIVSTRLGQMFQLIVDNVSRGFYWSNPDDGLDCKANALLDLCSNFWKFEPVDANGKTYNAFAFCTQIAYFGIAGAYRILYPKKYNGTISISFLDENGKASDLYNV